MRWILPNGRMVWKNTNKYKVDYDKKCRSKIQFQFKNFLKPYIFKHLVLEEFTLPGTRLSIDLLDLTTHIAYEIQGFQHIEYNAFFSKNSRSNYLGQISRDMRKKDYLEKNNYRLIEIYENEIPLLSHQWFSEKFGIKL